MKHPTNPCPVDDCSGRFEQDPFAPSHLATWGCTEGHTFDRREMERIDLFGIGDLAPRSSLVRLIS